MSSSDRMLRLALPALAIGLSLMLAGCFRPMYASVTPSGVPLDKAMAAVRITPMNDRVGQQVRNNLDYGLTGGGQRADARYTLDMIVTNDTTSSIVDVRTNEPQVDTVSITVTFTLTPIGSETPVLTGKNVATKSFDRTLQRFAALRANIDAENSAAKTVADQIRTRISLYFAEHS